MARIVLASGSPRRQELLTRIGIRDFTVRVPQVEEWYPQGLTPPEIVSYISREKSQAVASDADEIVITADTMVFLDDKKLGKPADEAEALQMLTALQGRRHTVCTGVTVRQGEKALTRAQHTDVYFRPATQRELKAYIAGGEPMDKAGAYGVQGQGALLVERINGDFFNVMGLPVLRLKSDYLAIATLGFAEIIRAIFQWDRLGPVTNGANALKSFPTFSSFNIENANGEVVLRLSTFVPFLLVAVCIGIMVLLINSTYGRAFKAIREDEVAAEAMGINLAKHKRMAFCISSFFAGVGGGLFAMFANQAQAKTFTTSMTYEILLIVVIGGIGSISGSCIASFLYVAASEWWLRFLDTETYIGAFKVPFLRTGFRMVVFSIIIMIVVLFFRRGLMGDRELSDVARSLRARLSGKSKKKEAAK